MADTQDLIQQRLDRIDMIPKKLIDETVKSEKQILKRVNRIMNSLETKGGQLVTSEANFAKIEEIGSRLRALITGTGTDLPPTLYIEAVKEYAGEFDTQRLLQDDYFDEALDSYEKKQVYKATMNSAKRAAISKFNMDSVEQVLVNPVKDNLNTAVTQGQSITDAMDNLRQTIQGDEEIDGQLTRHVKQEANDAFAKADRQYSQTVANDLGLIFYRYLGGLLADTRSFCMKRNNGYYHRKEIRQWGTIPQWQGRHRNTSPSTIFTLLGGYNCKHSLVPVPVDAVPRKAISRAKSKGFLDSK